MQSEIRHDLGPVVAPVAGEAAHTLLPAEVGAVDGVHHDDHRARLLYCRGCDRKQFPIGADSRGMAARAVVAEGGGKHPHRVHELVYGNPFENLDVLENGFRHLRGLFLPPWPAADIRLSTHTTTVTKARTVVRFEPERHAVSLLAVRPKYLAMASVCQVEA